MIEKAVVLVSGGLDSATTLAIAKAAGYQCYALSFDYGQRHRVELIAAQRVVDMIGVTDYQVIQMDLRCIGGSALTDNQIPVPTEGLTQTIPSTYVPARNTIFLSFALGWAEVLSAGHIFIGVNAVDYSGYPDCRPDFIQAFEKMANIATKMTIEGKSLIVHTPLIHWSKAKIIATGLQLGLDYGITISCYQPTDAGHACGICDACRLRAAGFRQINQVDPTIYVI